MCKMSLHSTLVSTFDDDDDDDDDDNNIIIIIIVINKLVKR